jgi:hypothetical protein
VRGRRSSEMLRSHMATIATIMQQACAAAACLLLALARVGGRQGLGLLGLLLLGGLQASGERGCSRWSAAEAAAYKVVCTPTPSAWLADLVLTGTIERAIEGWSALHQLRAALGPVAVRPSRVQVATSCSVLPDWRKRAACPTPRGTAVLLSAAPDHSPCRRRSKEGPSGAALGVCPGSVLQRTSA